MIQTLNISNLFAWTNVLFPHQPYQHTFVSDSVLHTTFAARWERRAYLRDGFVRNYTAATAKSKLMLILAVNVSASIGKLLLSAL